MAGRPQFPTRDKIDGLSIRTDSIREPSIGASAAGLTGVGIAIKRQLTMVCLGVTPASAQNSTAFRCPPQGARLTGLYFCPGSVQNHAVNEADTWIIDVCNAKTAVDLSVNACSLSNQTLAATQWKTIPLNNGNATLTSGISLRAKISVSGSPTALYMPQLAIEWQPVTDA